MLRELLGDRDDLDTEPRHTRIDIVLRAHLAYSKSIPMPAPTAWKRLVHEAMGRLDRIEPLLPPDSIIGDDEGRLALFAWKDERHVKAVCRDDGSLLLSAVELPAWQLIEPPRQQDDPVREADAPPNQQLQQMFRRVQASIHAWMEATDHLVPQRNAR